MMRTLRRFHKTIFGSIAIAMIATSMIGFGVNLGSDRAKRYAIKVNDEDVSLEDFYRQKRAVEERFRSQFGAEYQNLLQMLNINVSQRVADDLINGILIRQLGGQLGLSVSDREVASEITEMLGGSLANYEGVLARSGMAAPVFEAKVRQDLLRRRVSALLSNVALPSDAEIQGDVRRKFSSYDVEVAKIDASSLEKSVLAPTPDELSSFYNERKARFEEPEKVAFRYVILEGDRVAGRIMIEPSAIEEFYQTNPSRFTLPDSARVEFIQLDYPSDGSENAKGKVLDQAKEIIKEISQGTKFGDLAQKYSVEPKSREKGGDLGWVQAGSRGKEFDAVVFRDDPDFEPQLIERDGGVDIVRIVDLKLGVRRPLDEVRGEVEAELKKEEIPGYLAHDAEQLFSEWTAGQGTLNDFSAKYSLKVLESGGLLGRAEGASTDVRELTGKVLGMPAEPRQLIDLGSRLALVEVVERREAAAPPLEEIRDLVVAAFRAEGADKQALKKAEELIVALGSDGRSLTEVGKDAAIPVDFEKGVTLSSGGQGALQDEGLRRQLLSYGAVGSSTPKPVRGEGRWIVARIAAVTEPTAVDRERETSLVRRELATREGAIVLSSVLNTLKARAKTDMDATILVGDS